MIHFVIGTRPEAIKLAPIIKEVDRMSFLHEVCVTSQHRELLRPFVKLFNIYVDHDLKIMKRGQDLFEITTANLNGFRKLLNNELRSEEQKIEVVVVQGDTTSALSAALSAYYHKIPVAHVEAGLRTQDQYQPYPEEMNRRLIDQIASMHFAPTEQAKENLLSEGISSSRIHVTGNPVVDALEIIRNDESFAETQLPLHVEPDEKLVLVTIHRRENFGEPILNVCQAIEEIVSKVSNAIFAIPLHPNPNVQKVVNGSLKESDQVVLLPPLDYFAFLKTMERADLILTDSGGVQEEAPSFETYVHVLRNKTERPEGIERGIAELVGTSKDEIVHSVMDFVNSDSDLKMNFLPNPYGDGEAARRIVDVLTGPHPAKL